MFVLSLLTNLAAFPVILFKKTRSVSFSCLTLLGPALHHASPLAYLLVVLFTYSCSMVQVWEWSVCSSHPLPHLDWPPGGALYLFLFHGSGLGMVSLKFSSSASPWLTSWWCSLLILVPWFRFGNGQFAVLILCLTLADLLVVFCGVLGALILEVIHFFFLEGGWKLKFQKEPNRDW
jgi:hypothetical protein